uniref:Peptidase S1 domain-containing protein n=1 Tax=Anopheles minimus TaxID=112268 RepID=A0A182WF33_9DIPT
MDILLLVFLASVAWCKEFVVDPPAQYSTGNGFADCASRFSATWKIPVPEALGGVRAFQGEFKHMAAIGWTRSDGKIDYLCGGSLITWRFVLTAAHCAIDTSNIQPDTTRFGDTDLAGTDDDEYAQQVPIERFIKHPQYRQSKRYYDIALIKLDKDVQSNFGVCFACVWREYDAPSDLLEAVGFGALGFGEKLSSTLQKVQLRPLDTTACAERIPTSRRQMPEGLREDQMCAHSETMDTCEGDSGGPLQTELHDVFGNVYPQLVGVVSFGTPCTQGSTGVYTRVSSYLNWIEKEVNQSLSYEHCTDSSLCDRKQNPTISAAMTPRYPINRVGLLWERTETDIYQCGGLLIDYQYVLTSAVCVTSSKGHPRFVASSPVSDRATVEDVFVHPQYDRENSYFDIALVKLRQYANLEETNPICPWLKNQNGEKNSALFQVSASVSQRRLEQFGNSSGSSILQMVQGAQCTDHMDSIGSDLVCITRNITLVPNSCELDFGGPVLIEEASNVYRIRGVLSRRTQGCGSNLIFTDITPHMQWMEKIMFKNLNEWLTMSSIFQSYQPYLRISDHSSKYQSYWGNRKKNPTISAEVKSNYPVNRVGLLWEKTETDIYQCGGVLIDYQYVLTSAECVTTSKGYPSFVAWSPFSDRATVENVFVHPKYQRESPNFDIALVKLRQYANPQLFKPLCPWTAMQDDDWNGNPVQFGASISSLNGEPSEFRIYVQTTLHKYKRCAGKNNQLCIRRVVALIPGLCEIDYGGPVLTELNRNEYKVLGCKMIGLLQTIIVIAGAVFCQQFLDSPPVNYTVGDSFEDCERRFPFELIEYSVVQAVGGERAFQGEFQHMAAIGWTRSDGRIDYLCGGSLITWRYILTAAHCAVDTSQQTRHNFKAN